MMIRSLRSFGFRVLRCPSFAPEKNHPLTERREAMRLISLLGGAALPLLSLQALGVIITAPSSFTPAANAPLAGVLKVDTDVDTRVSISVNDGSEAWTRHFFEYSPAHVLPLFGFKPGRTNEITVVVRDRNGQETALPKPLTFVTAPLPKDFPRLHLYQSVPERMEPGYSLFMANVYYLANGSSHFYAVMVDHAGEVVWYNSPPPGFDIRQRENANLFITSNTNFVEMNLLGEVVQTWNPPLLPLNPHDGVPTGHGTILYLNDALENVPNFPSSTTSDPFSSTASVLYQRVVEISAVTSEVLHTWSPIDVLDPTRTSYLRNQGTARGLGTGWDTEHANAVIEDPRDDSLIVSLRNQNAVVKISRATGQLRWILGPPEGWGPDWQPYLLKPAGTPFAWQYGQHAPVLTAQGTLLLYDNGNFRASPTNATVADPRNYSRAVEYQIDEEMMEVSQVWAYGSTNRGDWLYTSFMGSAEPEPKTGNVLVDFSAVSYIDGVHPSTNTPSAVVARLREVTHDLSPEIVFDLGVSMFDNLAAAARNCSVYRAHRIPDLYPHPAVPVTDLSITFEDGIALLEFSGDAHRSYEVQTSADLTNWKTIGTATEYRSETGGFEFADNGFDEAVPRFYRIVTR